MKYIFEHDLMFLIKNKLKLLLTFLFCLAICLTVKIITHVSIDNDLVKCIFGMSINTINSGDILKIIIYILNITFYSYITLLVLMKDIEEGEDILFLRVKPTKWLIIKIFSLGLYDFALLAIQYVIFGIILNNIGTVNISIYDFIFNYFIVMINILMTIFIFVMCSNYKALYVFILLGFIIWICPLLIESNIIYLFIIIILLTLLDIKAFKYHSIKVFENYRR